MNNIISALNYLNCADLDHAGWIAVGMALGGVAIAAIGAATKVRDAKERG